MIKKNAVLAVSVMAMLVVGVARADVASKDYVDQAIGNVETDVISSTTGDGNVITSVSATGNQITATLGMNAEDTQNKVNTVRDTASATDTAYPSEKAVATALATKAESSTVDTLVETVGNAESGLVADVAAAQSDATAAGNAAATNAAEIGTITSLTTTAKDNLVNAVNELDAGKMDADLGESAANKVLMTNETGQVIAGDLPAQVIVDAELSPDSENPVQNKVINTALAGKVDIAQTVENANKAVVTDETGNITTGTITNDMVATDAAIDQSKISGLTDALGAKLDAETAADTYATKEDLANVNVNVVSSGAGAVVTNVSQADGTITVSKGNVQIPVGSETAETYASVWIQ